MDEPAKKRSKPAAHIGPTAPSKDRMVELGSIQKPMPIFGAIPRPVAAAVMMANRVYVGSLPYDCNADVVKAHFSQFGNIVAVSMPMEGSRSKGFCFVEFDNPASAANAFAMNGHMIFGRCIKVGKPTREVPAQTSGMSAFLPLPPSIQNAPGSVPKPSVFPSSDVNSTKIYVGSIAVNLTEAHIVNVFQAFGAIKSCELILNHETGTHKGYGFIEFETDVAAMGALRAMNGFELMGRSLKVGPATACPNGIVSASLVVNPKPLSQPGESAVEPPIVCSRALRLRNMVGPNDPIDDGLEEEAKSECQQYGTVNQLKIVSKSGMSPEVFILFDEPSSAAKARISLEGRWFAGRKVEADLVRAYDVFKNEEEDGS